MIDIPKLIDAADKPGYWSVGLAAFCTELSAQLAGKAREKAAKNSRGHKSYSEQIATAVVELNAVADGLRKYAAAPDPDLPIACRAVNQRGSTCIRTDAGHEAHHYPTLSEVLDAMTAEPPEEDAGPTPDDFVPASACGVQDHYGGDTPDRCITPPHGRDTNHGGTYSVWPWQDDVQADAAAFVAQGMDVPVKNPPILQEIDQAVTAGAGTPGVEKISAYLRGDTDELGTEPLAFPVRPPSGINGDPSETDYPDPCQPIGCDNGYHLAGCVFESVERSPGKAQGIITAAMISAIPKAANRLLGDMEAMMTMGAELEVELFSNNAGALTVQKIDPTVPAELEASMQPDPFDDALPTPDDQLAPRTATWRPAPDPRPLWLPREAAPLIPSSIRTTHVRTGEECGMAYRLLSRDGAPEVPAWWNVGGNTLHECARGIELSIIGGDSPHTLSEDAARALWAIKFREQIAALEAEAPFPMHQWRAANKGTENRGWWTEVGPLMVRDYSAASAQWHADGWGILTLPQPQRPPTREFFPAVPAMELEMRMPLMGTTSGGELTGHLDQAWFRLDEGDEWEIRIRDLKTGRELPTDPWQLEAYTLELRTYLANSGRPLIGGLDRCRLSAVYYDARNGKDGEVVIPAPERAPLIHYRAGAVLAMHANNSYPANPGTDWKAPCYLCSVRYACPIMAMKS